MTQIAPNINPRIEPGDVIAGKYRVEKMLGSGGMGFVIAAHHLQLDRKVAIKCLLPEILGNAEAVSRFTQEAKAAVRITSEHVVRVYDVGNLDNGAPYMVMEHLEGGDLGDWLKQKGVLSTEQAVGFVLQVCVAIAEAHSLGIIHRDLKPANIFCIQRPDGTHSVKVLDFGISKLQKIPSAGVGGDMTRTDAVVGSPYYMSPEHLRSARDVDARTDIWSLGVILYELLTGQVPFSGETLPDLAIRIVQDATPSVCKVRPDVPVGVDAAIRKCMEKDREQRYRNVAELALALVRFGPKRGRASAELACGIIERAGLSNSALVLPPSSDQRIEQPSETPEGAWGHTTRPAHTAKKWFTGSAVVVVAALGIAVLTQLRARAPSNNDGSIAAAAVASPTDAAGAHASAQSAAPAAAATTDVASDLVLPASDAGALAPAEPAPRASKTIGKSEKLAKPKAGSAVSPMPEPPSPPSPSATAKVNCSPSYTVDAAGRKHFKPECFRVAANPLEQ